ncbi:MAG: pseudaminic acid cytidylyltransferase [bacterium]|nr:pseudaminic acid cytidylyltransferase [bacterium]
MNTIAIITARGGSKRIPRKNIKEFMGKPMITYAIGAALKSNVFDEVMVSTDDFEIAEIAKKNGAKVPFMRSEKTANDMAMTYDVLEEVIDEYQKIGRNFDNLACIYPCVPFLKSETLQNAYQIFINSNCDTLVPVVKFSFPIQRAFRIDENNFLQYREPENMLKRSQDLEPMFHDVGMFYFCKIDEMKRNKKLIGNKAAYIEMDEMQIQDIDNVSDWKMAEMKYRIMQSV